MNELTMVLDELDSHQSDDRLGYLPQSGVQRLVAALQSEGGDMARVASVIETLATNNPSRETPPPRYACPSGNVLMPGNRNDIRTQTAGNGVMSCTDA